MTLNRPEAEQPQPKVEEQPKVDVTELIQQAIDILAEEQNSTLRCRENTEALKGLGSALDYLKRRVR